MAFKTYKEGQGVWSRGVVAAVMFVVGVFASFRLYDFLYVGQDSWLYALMNWKLDMPIVGWTFDGRLLCVGVVFFMFLLGGLWLYNYPKFVDFLIETETELRTRVKWPSRKDLVNASAVVVAAVILIGAWVLLCDIGFAYLLRDVFYEMFN